ncbi:MAG TPA: flagellar biosynthesis protein FlhA [Clostridia bacterium]|nr:flagellar biosynthesis protein FlhA [Clostridia bacterium]
MATSAARANLKKYGDLLIAAMVVSIVLLIIIPLTPGMLDFLLTVSIALSMTIFLITLFTTEPLQFSVFPSLLLVVTLYRLALNISSTRLILGEAQAGEIIAAFGNFVVGGNYVVGMVVFLIITVIQFVVITNGAGRVAEVTARFTLDAMPGKQMSIDADFNSGLITENEARQRRKHLQEEADFFGAMDGASKFVRGDAIAGLVIIIINIVGGLSIGVLQRGMEVGGALQLYTLLTVGDGLVSQIPALLVSTGTGIHVTRAATGESFGHDLTTQFFTFPRVLYLVGGMLVLMGFIPTMPTLVFAIMGALTGYLAYALQKEQAQKVIEREEMELQEQQKVERQEPEDVFSYLQVDVLEIEIGYNLIPLTDEAQGGDLLQRLTRVRRQCASEMGIFLRPIRIRDNLELKPNAYVFKIKGEEIVQGEVMPGHYLVMDPTGETTKVKGIPTVEPTFGLSAWWVSEDDKEEAELADLTVVDCATVLITHLTEFIKTHAHELLGRQELQELIDEVKKHSPAVVEELIPNLLTLGEIQKVIQNLLRERVPVRDLVTVLEALADAARTNKENDFLTEYARNSLARTISRQYASPGGKIAVITLHPKVEQLLIESTQQTQFGSYPALEPGKMQLLLSNVKKVAEKLTLKGMPAVVLCSSQARMLFRRLTERYMPQLAVLSLNEISQEVEVEAVGTVMLN